MLIKNCFLLNLCVIVPMLLNGMDVEKCLVFPRQSCKDIDDIPGFFVRGLVCVNSMKAEPEAEAFQDDPSVIRIRKRMHIEGQEDARIISSLMGWIQIDSLNSYVISGNIDGAPILDFRQRIPRDAIPGVLRSLDFDSLKKASGEIIKTVQNVWVKSDSGRLYLDKRRLDLKLTDACQDGEVFEHQPEACDVRLPYASSLIQVLGYKWKMRASLQEHMFEDADTLYSWIQRENDTMRLFMWVREEALQEVQEKFHFNYVELE